MAARRITPANAVSFLRNPPSSTPALLHGLERLLDAYPGGPGDGRSWTRVVVMECPVQTLGMSSMLALLCRRAKCYPQILPDSDIDLFFRALLDCPEGSLQVLGLALEGSRCKDRAAVALAMAVDHPQRSRAIAAVDILIPAANANAPSLRPGWSCLQHAAYQGFIAGGIVPAMRWDAAGADWSVSTPSGQTLVHLMLEGVASRGGMELSVAGSLPSLVSMVPSPVLSAPDIHGFRACDLALEWASSPRARSALSAVPQGTACLERLEMEACMGRSSTARRTVPRL